ncbi:unnamed protein product, partial [Rotaria magnacalcarata]
QIQSGRCRVDDQCIIMLNRKCVEITNIYRDNTKTDVGVYGENVQLKLKKCLGNPRWIYSM